MPFAECEPLLFAPARNPPSCERRRAAKICSTETCIISCKIFGGNRRFGNDFFAACVNAVHPRRFFVGGDTAFELIMFDARVILHYPIARRFRRFARHILPRRVARRVIKPQIKKFRGRKLLNIAQFVQRSLSFPTCAFISAKFSFTQTPNLLASRADGKTKTGARCIASSTTVTVTPPDSFKQFHSAIIRSDQSSFGRRQRHEKFAFCIFAIDQKRSRQDQSELAPRR